MKKIGLIAVGVVAVSIAAFAAETKTRKPAAAVPGQFTCEGRSELLGEQLDTMLNRVCDSSKPVEIWTEGNNEMFCCIAK
jgi:hypothetical protein